MTSPVTSLMTRKGDDGVTQLANGRRISKSSQRLAVIGAVDELNSVLGMVLAEALPEKVSISLRRIQHELFNVGAELALCGESLVTEQHVQMLEKEGRQYESVLRRITAFILPGGSKSAALLYYARARCREAERAFFILSEKEAAPPLVGQYLNRLSDWLFLTARYLNQAEGVLEVLWQKSD